MISLHIEVQQTQDADFCEDLGGRVSTRAFESLLKSEVLGTKKDDKKVGEICETVKKYLMKTNKQN